MATEKEAKKPRRSIEEFMSSFVPASERDNYVVVDDNLAPKAVAEDPKKVEAYKKVIAEDNKIANDGSINVSGILTDEPVKPSVKETIKKSLNPEGLVPPYNPEPEVPFQKPYQPVEEETSFKMPVIPQVEDSSAWERAMIGATPLLVGLLTGNKLEGAQTSANYLIGEESDRYKRAKDLNSKLAELAWKQAFKERTPAGKQGSKRFQAQNIALKDGTNVKAAFDTYTGKYHMPDGSEIPSNFIRAGYAVNPEEYDRRKDVSSEHKRSDADYLGQNTRIDPTTGQLGVVRNGAITPVEGSQTGKFNVKQEKDVKAMVDEFTKSAPYKEATQALSLAPQVSSLLDAASRKNDPNSVAGSSVVLTMIRQAQRVGVASDRDAAAMGGTQQWEESVKRIEQKLLGNGQPLTARDIQDLREISNIYTKRAKDLLGSYYGEAKQAYSQRYNLTPDDVESQLGYNVKPYMSTAEKPIEAKNAPKRVVYNDKTWTSPNREQNVAFEMGDGVVYWTTEGDWKLVKEENPKAKRLK